METKTVKVCTAIRIDVSCMHNDSTDIKCGGAPVLGYDFYVSPDEDINKLEKTIKGWVKKYRRPFMGISHHKHNDFLVKNLWTAEMIEKCIKDNGIF